MASQSNAPASERIVTLDVVRGIAVMGIFSVNVTAFAMIFPAYMNPSAYGWESWLDPATWYANFILVDGKMRSLFSMLFGASMLLVIDRAVRSGASAAKVHVRRMIVLAIIGLFHFYVIWFGDILFLYAVTGMIAFLFRKMPAKRLVIWSISLFLLSTAMMAGASAMFRQLDAEAHAADATTEEIRQWNKSVAWGAQTEEKTREQTAIQRAPLPTRVEHMVEDRAAEPFAGVLFMLPETLALMLLGMAGYRSGFLTGEWGDSRYRRIALWTLLPGIVAGAAVGAVTWRSDFYLPLIFFNMMVVATPIRVAMALGYAALIILLFRRPSGFRERVAAVGRAAFTNYLGTSIVAALIFFGDGLALFGRLSRFEAWLLVPLFWLAMLAWSKPWLDRFQYGPLEWLWRSLARLEVQPMRRPGPAGAAAAGA